MSKWIYRIIVILLIAVFLFSAGSLLSIYLQYRQSAQVYETAASQFVQPVEDLPDVAVVQDAGQNIEKPVISEFVSESVSESDAQLETANVPSEHAPIQVDFAALQAINPEIAGWIYCEGTNINYPVLKGVDNDFYLHRSYDRTYLFTGSIFAEAENRPLFQDNNTIIYGHNMRDGSMFAALEDWADQSYYDQHPVMWFLTPEQDYKVLLFSEYTTSADSAAYQIFTWPDSDFMAYLEYAKQQSNFVANVELDPDAHYILLSTCAYVFDNARYVMHGMLVPVGNTAGGQ